MSHVTLSLTGLQRLELDNVVRLAARIRTDVERSVVRSLRARLIPAAMRAEYELPGSPNSFKAAIALLPAGDAVLEDSERAMLLQALNHWQETQGFLDEHVDWFFEIKKALAETP
jgi:hypothetical protein